MIILSTLEATDSNKSLKKRKYRDLMLPSIETVGGLETFYRENVTFSTHFQSRPISLLELIYVWLNIVN